MDWSHIRAHYARTLTASGKTQEDVAEAGRLRGQNIISKMVHNRKQGPVVGTFIKAVQGLGIPLSKFFAEVEERLADRELDLPAGAVDMRLTDADGTTTIVEVKATPRADLIVGLQDVDRVRRALAAFYRVLTEPTPRAVPKPRRRRPTR